MVLYGLMNNWDNHEKVGFLWLGGEERKGFFTPFALVRHRGGRAKLERKDFTGGLVKPVRIRRIGVEGLHDFRL